jgi:hypothetical protein
MVEAAKGGLLFFHVAAFVAVAANSLASLEKKNK